MKTMQILVRFVTIVSIAALFSGCTTIKENLSTAYENIKKGHEKTFVSGDQWRPAFLPVYDYEQLEVAKRNGLLLTAGMSFILNEPQGDRRYHRHDDNRNNQREETNHRYGYPLKVYINYEEAKICTPSYYIEEGLWVHFSRGAARAIANSNYLQPQYFEFIAYCEVVEVDSSR